MQSFVNDKKCYIFTFIFIVFIFTISLFVAAENTSNFTLPDKILLKKSIEFVVYNYLKNNYAIDNSFLSKWIINVYPHQELEKYVYKTYSKLVKQPGNFNSNFLRWVDKNYKLKQPLCALNKNESEMDCLLLQSIWCDVIPPSDNLLKTLREIMNANKYSSPDMLSHILLALSELQKKKCLTSFALESLLEETKQSLLKFLSQSKSSYGEGVAILLYAGFVEDIQEEWIELIRKTLRKKITKKCNTCSSEPHDILLEIYALAQWYVFKER